LCGAQNCGRASASGFQYQVLGFCVLFRFIHLHREEFIMLSTVKEKALAGFNIGANFVEACADRQIGFATYYLQTSLENAKKLRHSKSLSDVVALEKDYLKGVQEQLTELAAANTEALKQLGSSTKEYVASIVKPAAASVESAIESDGEKKTVRKSV
jgi:hypothetical protein